MVAVTDIEVRPGAVLGLGWGTGPDEARARLGTGSERRHADTLRLELAAPVAIAGLSWRAELLFVLDQLSAVTLVLVGPRSQLDDASLLTAARSWLNTPLSPRDEGLWVAEDAHTSLTIDLLEGRVAFADAEAP